MRILAIDTAMEICSVALWNNGDCFAYSERCYNKHTQRILPLIKKILCLGNTALTDLDALAFSRGPGSFTGVRISTGIAQGLALGANLPMIGVSTLLTMAQGAFFQTGATRILTIIDAHMGEFYWAEYIRSEQGIWYGEETEAVYKPEEINARLKTLSGEWTMVGSSWKAWPKITQDINLKLTDSNILLSTAKEMLPIACQLLADGKTVAVEHAEPIYLRNEEMWKKFQTKNN